MFVNNLQQVRSQVLTYTYFKLIARKRNKKFQNWMQYLKSIDLKGAIPKETNRKIFEVQPPLERVDYFKLLTY